VKVNIPEVRPAGIFPCMTPSSLTWVTTGAALLALACAHEIDEWGNDEEPSRSGSSVSANAGSGGGGGRSGTASGGSGSKTTSGSAGTEHEIGGSSGQSGSGGTAPSTSGGSAGTSSETGGATGLAGSAGEAGSGGGTGPSGGSPGEAGAAGSTDPGSGGAPNGDVCAALPEWELKSYEAGDQVTDGDFVYQCKPWPATDWCGTSEYHYEPGTGSAWQDAWTKVGPC
jgi:hypothetical protein